MEKKVNLLYKLLFAAKVQAGDGSRDLIMIDHLKPEDFDALKDCFGLKSPFCPTKIPSNEEIGEVQAEYNAAKRQLDSGEYKKKDEGSLVQHVAALDGKIRNMKGLLNGVETIQKKDVLDHQEQLFREFLQQIGVDATKRGFKFRRHY